MHTEREGRNTDAESREKGEATVDLSFQPSLRRLRAAQRSRQPCGSSTPKAWWAVGTGRQDDPLRFLSLIQGGEGRPG